MRDILYSAKRSEGAFKNDEKLGTLSTSITLEKSILGLNHLWLCENRSVDERVMHKLAKTVRGTRSLGSAALEMAYVAEGSNDGYLAIESGPWDIAAGAIIIKEVDRVTTNRHGEKNMLNRDSVVTCNQQIHGLIVSGFLEKGKK